MTEVRGHLPRPSQEYFNSFTFFKVLRKRNRGNEQSDLCRYVRHRHERTREGNGTVSWDPLETHFDHNIGLNFETFASAEMLPDKRTMQQSPQSMNSHSEEVWPQAEAARFYIIVRKMLRPTQECWLCIMLIKVSVKTSMPDY